MKNHINKIEILLFDILYLIMNCDSDVNEIESAILKDAIRNIDDNSKKLLEKRRHHLDGIINKGFKSIKEAVINSAKPFTIFPKSIAEPLEENYLRVIKKLILADENVHKNEEILFKEICRVWKIKYSKLIN